MVETQPLEFSAVNRGEDNTGTLVRIGELGLQEAGWGSIELATKFVHDLSYFVFTIGLNCLSLSIIHLLNDRP